MILIASSCEGFGVSHVLPRVFVPEHDCDCLPHEISFCVLLTTTLLVLCLHLSCSYSGCFFLACSPESICYRVHLPCAQNIGRYNNQTTISCQILNLCSLHTMKRWFSYFQSIQFNRGVIF